MDKRLSDREYRTALLANEW